jgi:hypothetical protein
VQSNRQQWRNTAAQMNSHGRPLLGQWGHWTAQLVRRQCADCGRWRRRSDERQLPRPANSHFRPSAVIQADAADRPLFGQCRHWDRGTATSAMWPIAVAGEAGPMNGSFRGRRIHTRDPNPPVPVFGKADVQRLVERRPSAPTALTSCPLELKLDSRCIEAVQRN